MVSLCPQHPYLRSRLSGCRPYFPLKRMTSQSVPCVPSRGSGLRAVKVGRACVGQYGTASLRVALHTHPEKSLSSKKQAQSVFSGQAGPPKLSMEDFASKQSTFP